MNIKKAITFLLVTTMVATTAAILIALKKREKIGPPGVKVVVGEVEFPDGKKVITNRVDLPEAVLDYTSKPVALSEVEIRGLPSDTTFGRRLYQENNGSETLISVVLMGNDRTSLHPPQYCLVGQGWKIEKEEAASVHIERPVAYDLPLLKLTLTKQFQTRDGQQIQRSGVYAYWFVADKKLHSGQRLWSLSWDVLRTGILDRWAYVTYFSVCLPGQEEATFQRMKTFIAASVPQFQVPPMPGATPNQLSSNR